MTNVDIDVLRKIVRAYIDGNSHILENSDWSLLNEFLAEEEN